MMKWLEKLAAVVLIAALHYALIFGAIYWGVMQPGFFDKEYKKYAVAGQLQMEEQELSTVTEALLSYLKGERGDPEMAVHIAGVQTEFFNERERAHLEEIAGIFDRLKAVLTVSIVVMAAAGILLLYRSKRRLMCAVFLAWELLLGAVCVGAGVWMNRHLMEAVNLFHRMFFANELWILNPAKDRLIWLFPRELFMDALIMTGWIAGIPILAGTLYSVHTLINLRKTDI